MKAKLTGLLALTILTVMAVSFCQAQTAYVSDMLILTFREGPGATYAVKQTLKSNTPLTVLEEKNGFLKVELASGDQGWVDKNFIMFDPPKAVIIERLTREKQALEAELQTLKETAGQSKDTSSALAAGINDTAAGLSAEVAGLKQENKKIARQLKQTQSEFSTLKQAANNVSGTLEENKRLKTENKTLTNTVNRLKNNSGSDSVFRSAMIKWFLAGFGVLLTGWIIGRSVSPKRRSGSLLD